MSEVRLDDAFDLIYLVFNTIFNLTTQEAQVRCFRNAARHLKPRRAFCRGDGGARPIGLRGWTAHEGLLGADGLGTI